MENAAGVHEIKIKLRSKFLALQRYSLSLVINQPEDGASMPSSPLLDAALNSSEILDRFNCAS